MFSLAKFSFRFRLCPLSKIGLDLGWAIPYRSICSRIGPEDSKQHFDSNGPFVEPEPDDEVVQKEEWYQDGKLVFTFDHAEKLNENYDWSKFERAFGIDKLHDLDIDNWEFPSSATIEEYEETDENEQDFDEVIFKDVNEYPGRDVEEKEAKRQKDGSQLDVLQSEAKTSESIPVNIIKSQTTEFKKSAAVLHREVRDGSRRSHSDGSTHKLQRARIKAQKSHLKQSESRTPQKRTRLPEEMLHVPVNLKRPGLERRIRGLEALMERIATEVLYNSGSEFNICDATLQHVMLSPDGFSLTLYYEIGNSRILKDKEAHQRWSRRLCGKVRSALAREMYTKRVPNVKLVLVEAGRTPGSFGTPSGRLEELDKLFGQIAEERDREKYIEKSQNISSTQFEA